jgi:hypothetical protein
MYGLKINFILLPNVQITSGAHPASYPRGNVFIPCVSAAGSSALPLTAEVKNE